MSVSCEVPIRNGVGCAHTIGYELLLARNAVGI